MAISALLCPPLVDQAGAACNPPKDISSCRSVLKEQFADTNFVPPETPFLVTDPQMGKTFVLTHSDREPAIRQPKPTNRNCDPPRDVSGCYRLPARDLTTDVVAKESSPYLVILPNGQSMVASPMPE
jgi:hypothetical protein